MRWVGQQFDDFLSCGSSFIVIIICHICGLISHTYMSRKKFETLHACIILCLVSRKCKGKKIAREKKWKRKENKSKVKYNILILGYFLLLFLKTIFLF